MVNASVLRDRFFQLLAVSKALSAEFSMLISMAVRDPCRLFPYG
jgi:hypothetical protein